MIETTYMISAVSCIMTAVGCLTIGWLIGQHLSSNDRARLAIYGNHERERLELNMRADAGRMQQEEARNVALTQVRTQIDANRMVQESQAGVFPRIADTPESEAKPNAGPPSKFPPGYKPAEPAVIASLPRDSNG